MTARTIILLFLYLYHEIENHVTIMDSEFNIIIIIIIIIIVVVSSSHHHHHHPPPLSKTMSPWQASLLSHHFLSYYSFVCVCLSVCLSKMGSGELWRSGPPPPADGRLDYDLL